MSSLVITDELKKEIRQAIFDIENNLKSIDSVDFETYIGDNEACPLKHSFSDGIYVREIFIPQGMLLTGKIHKHKHPNFLLKGEVMVKTKKRPSKDSDIKKRILEEIEKRGGNKSELARQMSTPDLEISPNYLASVLTNQDKGFSASMLKGFSAAGIDIEWLITGDNKKLEEWKKRALDAEARIEELEENLKQANFLSKELKKMIMNGNIKSEI